MNALLPNFSNREILLFILVPEVNVAHSRLGAQVLQGEMRTALLDGETTNYDMERGFTRHPIEDGNAGIVVRLGNKDFIVYNNNIFIIIITYVYILLSDWCRTTLYHKSHQSPSLGQRYEVFNETKSLNYSVFCKILLSSGPTHITSKFRWISVTGCA